MRRLALLALALFGWTGMANAQANGLSNGYCLVGAVAALTQGLNSTNRLMGVIPSCTISVYQHGTMTLATIYTNVGGTPLANPFTATSAGFWQFYAPNGSQYDVVGSGGIAPNTYPSATLIPNSGGGGGGGASSGPTNSVQFAQPFGQFGSDPDITINATSHTFLVAGFGISNSGIGLCGIVSTNCVYQTALTTTAGWTGRVPAAAPSSATNTNCLTGLPPASGVVAESWSPCTQLVFDIRAYGAVSGSDATTAVEGALTDALAVGGIVYFPPGVWPINGAINSACDAIICLPSVQPTASAQQVKFAGVSRNRQDAQGPNNLTGSVITTTTSGDSSSAIFGVPQVTAPFGNNIDAYFSDLTFRASPNPHIGCINMYQAAGAWIDGIRGEVGENYTGTHTQPTNVNTCITLPRTGNDTLSGLTRSEISGWYQGVNFSEHAYFNDVWVAFGIQGYAAEPGFNPVTGHFGCEEVALCISVSGGEQMDVDVAIELDPMNVFGCASWCYTTTDVYDPNNDFKGWIRYYLSEANVGNVSFPIRVNTGSFSSPAAVYYNLYTTALTKILAPIFTSTGTLPTCINGTGVTCAVAANSTESRGTLTLTLSGVTTDTPLATVDFGVPLAGAPFCQAWQAGGAAYYGIFVGGGASGTSFNVNNTISLTGVSSLVVGYSCQL